ncbi:cold-shock protein [Bacillus sp. 03113]|uniref:cold-shock protein n=1 Tax=Bacillus sp. 03113 TaxID=2578211 RepID=UPI00215C7D1E|nr:cold-shock protein [Bacillus sp. 03113]
MGIFFNKRAQEDLEEPRLMNIEVYSCNDNNCNGWMRKDFASTDLKCPFCGQDMTSEFRELPVI